MNGVNTEVLDRIRDCINKNDLRAAVDQLVPLLKGRDADLYNESIAQSARLVALRKRERQGVATPSEVEAGEARLRVALLELVDEIPEKLSRRQMPFATPSVKFDPPAQSSIEKIFGVNHLKSIAWLRRGLEVSRSVCRVLTPSGLGSGFVFANHRLMTNNHVLPDRATAAASRIEFNYEEDSSGKIVPSVEYVLKPDSLQTDPELDFTVVDIEATSNSIPLDNWGCLELSAPSVPQPGDHVTIIQHPLGGPKQIAITANQIVNIYDFRLQYTTDTQPGSSGSPVFNDDWKVIALHHAGGDLIINERRDRMFANEGILVSSILRKIRG